MAPHLLEAMADFAELDRLRVERRRAGQSVASTLGWSDSQLTVAFETIQLHVAEGLTVTAGAILAGVTRRTIAAWVKLADERRAPWAGWLDELTRQDANRRRRVLRELRAAAGDDSRVLRDLANQLGRPSAFEHEIEALRRSKTAAMDLMVMPSDADRNRDVRLSMGAEGDEQQEGGAA